MSTKEYLSQLKQIDMRIDQKREEIEDLRRKALTTSSQDLKKDRVQTSPDTDAEYTRLIQRVMDMTAELNRDIDKFISTKNRIIEQIQKISDQRYASLLFKRYVQYKKFEVIADEMHYVYPYIIQLHAAALKQFEETYGILYKT